MTCSNSVKCPGGTYSLQSNFTFGQNELDPWSPNWANQQDILVPQQQDIAMSDCARFALTSDGTSDGTQIDVGDMTDDQACSHLRPQKTPIALAEEGSALQTTRSSGGLNAVTTGRPQLQQSSRGTKLSISRSTIFIVAILSLLPFAPGAQAASSRSIQNTSRGRAELHVREVSDKVKVFAQDLGSNLANIANGPDQTTEDLAHSLVANVVTSICKKNYQGNAPDQFSPTVVQACIKSVYGGETAALPAGQFLAVFGASLLCNYVVGEVYPVAQEFVEGGCEELQELVYGGSTSMSTTTSAQTSSTRFSTERFMTENLPRKSTNSERSEESSPTQMSSPIRSSISISVLTPGASKSSTPPGASSSPTQSKRPDSVSENSSVSQEVGKQSQSTDTSTTSVILALQEPSAVTGPNSRSASSSLVSPSPGSSRTLSSHLVFAQLARSSEKGSGSNSPLTSILGTSVDAGTSTPTPTPTSTYELMKSTAQSSKLATPSPESPTTIMPTTSDITRVPSSSISATPERSQVSSPWSKSAPLDTISPSTSGSSTSLVSLTSPRNISIQTISPSSLHTITSSTPNSDPGKFTSTLPPGPSGISSPPLPPLIANNSTTKPPANWTVNNTTSYATFPQPLWTKDRDRSSSPPRTSSTSPISRTAPPSQTLPSPTSPSHTTHYTTRSSSPYLTSTTVLTPVHIPGVQTIRITTVLIVGNSAIATLTRTSHTSTTRPSAELAQSSTKARYEGAGGFIAKGFNGVW